MSIDIDNKANILDWFRLKSQESKRPKNLSHVVECTVVFQKLNMFKLKTKMEEINL